MDNFTMRQVRAIWSDLFGSTPPVETEEFVSFGGTLAAAEILAARISASIGTKITGADIIRLRDIQSIVEFLDANSYKMHPWAAF